MPNLLALWSEKMFDIILIFLNLSGFDLWPKMRSTLENVLCTLEKKGYLLLSDGISYKYQLSLPKLSCHSRPVSLLIFCLDRRSAHLGKWGVQVPPVLLCYCPFLLLCLSIFTLYFEACLYQWAFPFVILFLVLAFST